MMSSLPMPLDRGFRNDFPIRGVLKCPRLRYRPAEAVIDVFDRTFECEFAELAVSTPTS